MEGLEGLEGLEEVEGLEGFEWVGGLEWTSSSLSSSSPPRRGGLGFKWEGGGLGGLLGGGLGERVGHTNFLYASSSILLNSVWGGRICGSVVCCY